MVLFNVPTLSLWQQLEFLSSDFKHIYIYSSASANRDCSGVSEFFYLAESTVNRGSIIIINNKSSQWLSSKPSGADNGVFLPSSLNGSIRKSRERDHKDRVVHSGRSWETKCPVDARMWHGACVNLLF